MLRGIGITLGCWLLGAIVLRVGLVQPEYCPAVDAASLQLAATEAADWIARSVQPDGTYVYEWDASSDTFSDDYNEVRHAGVTMALYQWGALGNDAYIDTADQGLSWMLANLERREGWAGLRNPQNSWMKLGATSLLSIGLSHRAAATGDTRYDDLQRELGNFMVNLQREDGSFLNYLDANTGEPVPDITSLYATGEAFWALTLLHEAFPGEGWDEPARAVADYLATQRDADEDFPFPPWPDQWAAYGFGEMAHRGLDSEHIEYLESLAGRFGLVVRWESQRRDSSFSFWTRGPSARGGAVGVWTEGIAGLWRASTVDERLADLQPALEERALCGAGMLVDRQVSANEAEEYARPEMARGAWFADDATRMDDQQHALSGLILALEILESEEGPWSR